jgi:predicted aspartyl protease
MAGQIVMLDFGRGTAALLPPTTSDRVAGKGAQLVMAGSIPDGKQLTLPVTLNGVRGLALLDTGSRATIINFRFASAAGLDPSSEAFHDGDPTRGASQDAVKTRVGPIGTVRFAGIVRKNVQARIVDMPFLKGSGLTEAPVMILGVDLLRSTRLTVDYSKRRFWLAPSNCSN